MTTVRRVQFLWDFYGERARAVAEHHQRHIEEFAVREGLAATAGSHLHAEGHYCAWLILSEPDALKVRAILRPNRALLVEEP